MKIFTLTSFLLLFLLRTLSAQNALMHNMGALIYTAPGSIVKVQNGSFNNTADGTFTNHGTTTIDSSFYNNALSEGNGNYRVGLHWVNNKIFIPDSSHAFLFGDNQFITGDSVTYFFDLSLEGSGIKTQQIRSYTLDSLILNDRELATDTFFMHVLNTDTGAIQRSSGFVSSLGNGKLYRSMNSVETYLFPTGSSLGTNRYAPVTVNSKTALTKVFGARLANVNADLEGYDRSLVDNSVCNLNPQFFYRLNNPTGNSDAEFSLFFDAATDSLWDGIAHWNPGAPAHWEIIPGTNTGQTFLNFVAKNSWNEYTNSDVFILGKVRPETPTIVGRFEACGNAQMEYVAEPEIPGLSYDWSMSPGTLISNQGENPAIIQWDSLGGNGFISLAAVSAAGCASLPANQSVTVYPAPYAAFSYNPNIGFGSTPISFTNYSVGADYYSWLFGDGNVTVENNPTHAFNQEGEYEIILISSTEHGCADTAYGSVTIIDGFNIPNIITPNGDGVNDFFELTLTGYEDFSCAIFNRWGETVYKTDQPSMFWDGSALGKGKASDGVYFVVIQCSIKGKPFKYEGHITVLTQ